MPQHAADYIKTLISQQKSKDPAFSIQKMCDDLNLPKSTIDKFLSRQTSDTAWTNVSAMVTYLGGSLDHLAGIQARAIKEEALAASDAEGSKTIKAEYPALALLVESYEKEIRRNADAHQQEVDRVIARQQAELERVAAQHEDYLGRFRRINEESRAMASQQHDKAVDALTIAYDKALAEQRSHLDAAIRGRNVWRSFSFVLLCVLLVAAVYMTWEFSNIYGGITGYLLQKHGLISIGGGMM